MELLDLPGELLYQVMRCLFIDSDETTRELVPSSLTCRRLRNAVAPLLFRQLHIRLTQKCVDRRTFNILVGLAAFPNTFVHHVRHLVQHDDFGQPENGYEELNLDNELVYQMAVQGLGQITNLKAVTVGCLNSPLLSMISSVLPEHPMVIITNVCTCVRPAETDTSSAMTLVCRSDTKHQFAISANSFRGETVLQPWDIHCPDRVTSLSLRNISLTVLSTCFDFRRGNTHFSNFQNLRELHLSSTKATSRSEPFEDFAETLSCTNDLVRLSLVGSDLCSAFLKVISRFNNLESLRLNATMDRIFHAHLRNHDFEGLPYLKLPKLKSLEIRYISRYLSVEHIVPHDLEHLRIEYHNRSEKLSSFDIRYIARIAPGLECFEMNPGALTNLWHPTAIAGVDVDMEVYGILDALSAFKHLRRLRFFPSYWQSTRGYLHFVQPVADEQAVRIYNHLRLRCRKLQLLLISCSYIALNSGDGRFVNGQYAPVKWVVRSTGIRTFLKTHEARKDYHLDQVWEGDRRLTMTNKIHKNRQLHFDELQDWVLPSYEFVFDEPHPCQNDEMTSNSTL